MIGKILPLDLARWMATGSVPPETLVGLEAGPGGWVAYTVVNVGQWPYDDDRGYYKMKGVRVTPVCPTPAAAYAALAAGAGPAEDDGDRDELVAWRGRALAAEEALEFIRDIITNGKAAGHGH